ncbi:MAG: alpha/beta fold hydrolase [Promethearchaeota archaeon]
MTESYTMVNGINICYEIKGEGYPIILVHGFGSKKESWIAQFSVLAERFRVIRFDNRSAGKSDRPIESYNMETLANDIRGLMDSLNIDTAHIIGWSMGGIIVQNFVLKYPHRVNKVVLINTVPDIPDEVGIEWLRKSRLEELELIKKDPEKAFWQGAHIWNYREFRKQMEADPKKKWHGLWSVEDEIRESTINMPTPRDIENQINALKTHDTLKRLSEVQNQTLLLAASRDRVCPKSGMVKMHERIPNSTLKVIEKAGHNSPKSRAPEVNKIIIDFLEIEN